MADVKISGLPASTTPLAGTEVLPIVQSGVTKKVAVSDLTAGRAVNMLSETINANTVTPSAGSITGTNSWQIGANASGNIALYDSFAGNTALIFRRASGTAALPTAVTLNSVIVAFGARAYGTTGYSSTNRAVIASIASETWTDTAQGAEVSIQTTPIGSTALAQTALFKDNGDVTINRGNLVIGTSGKGIDFSATPGTGTSELLADYEEGTWTPVFTAAAGTITSTTVNAAKYTKVGRIVSLSFDVTITNNGTGAVAITVTGLPFAAAAAYSSCGTIIEVAAVGFGGFINQNSTTAIVLVNAAFAYPGGTGYRLIGSIAYNA